MNFMTRRQQLENELEVLEMDHQAAKKLGDARTARRIRFRQLDILRELNSILDQLEAELAQQRKN